MIQKVGKRHPTYRDAQLVHARRVRLGPIPGRILLVKVHRHCQPAQRSPLVDPPLKRTLLARLECAQVTARQLLKQRLHLKAGIDLQKGYYLLPYTCDRILARVPAMRLLRLAWQLAQPNILAGRRLAHGRLARGRRYRYFVPHDKVE